MMISCTTTTNTLLLLYQIYKHQQQDNTAIIASTTIGHPIEQITFPSTEGNINNNQLKNLLKDDDDDDDLFKEEDNIISDEDVKNDLVVDTNDYDHEDNTTSSSNVPIVYRIDVFIGLLFLGSIAYVGCWVLPKYIAPDLSDDAPKLTTMIIKLIGWFILLFLAIIAPSSSCDDDDDDDDGRREQQRGNSNGRDGKHSSINKNKNTNGDKDDEHQQQKHNQKRTSVSRKIQMLIVYMISWNLFVNIQREEQIIHQYNDQRSPYLSYQNRYVNRLSCSHLVLPLHAFN